MDYGVTYLQTACDRSWGDLRKYLVCVSSERRARLERITAQEHRKNALLCQLLLRYELMRICKADNTELRFACTPLGKPYLPDFSDVHFSVSHTDGLVAVAYGDAPVGVDVEKIKTADLRIAERYFTLRETHYIRQSADAQRAFYEIWTKKEAYLKRTGTGLTRSLRAFDVFDAALDVQWETHTFSTHVLSLCRKKEAGICPAAFRAATLEQILGAFDTAVGEND